MQDPSGDDSVESDLERTRHTAEHLVGLTRAGWRLVVTHGNGPQVGNHLYRSELAYEDAELPLLPLDVCVADTQGGMGYVLQQSLANAFHEAGIPAVVTTVVTQVLVDADDPAFAAPSKPVGEMIPVERVVTLRERGWTMVEDTRRGGWRRVVASPDPLEIVEGAAIRALVDTGVVVIAAGGGGVPVKLGEDGSMRGVPAVIDKDLASALLATDLKADLLLILTDVGEVSLGYDGSEQRAVEAMTVSQARAHQAAGEFSPGSMGPKVEAACRFAAATGSPAVITSIERAERAVEQRTGTRITPD